LIAYRPEIDGLRAVAVMPVVAYHAGFPGFQGGYIGVDIFFVISGYLITSLIIDDIISGKFSFRHFYERRARRILPALFLITIASIPFSLALMLPDEFESYSRSVVSVALFGSNFHFWLESGYFDTAIEMKPLVHTWSLAVEEQYYLIYPILLVAVTRLGGGRVNALLWIILAMSLTAAALFGPSHPDANFYLLPGRMWELMIGGLLANYERTGAKSAGPKLASWLGVVGMACIVVSLFLFDERTAHPGLITLLPVAGTALIIRFGKVDGPVARFLSLKGVVGIGLISYSLYLWHQPVFAFARLSATENLGGFESGLLIALSFGLAAASWKFVELPFRNRRAIQGQTIWRLGGIFTLVITGLGLSGSIGAMKPNIDPLLERVAEAADDNVTLMFEKDGRPCLNRMPPDACVLGAAEKPPTWALVGDSYAAAMAASLDKSLLEEGLAAVELVSNGCPYAPGLLRIDNGDCLTWHEYVKARLDHNDIESVVLVGRYVWQMEKLGFDNQEGGKMGPSAGYTVPDREVTEAERRREVAAGIQAAVGRLLRQGKRVILVYPIPEVGWDVPRRLFSQFNGGIFEPISTSLAVYHERNRSVFEAFDGVEDATNLLRVYPHELFCDSFIADRCATANRATIFYSDQNHLSLGGADLLIEHILSEARSAWGDLQAG
jgi:peptidoglycan/LPS O-acetylase OafA/YrhL